MLESFNEILYGNRNEGTTFTPNHRGESHNYNIGGVRYKNVSTGNFINVKFYKIVKGKYSVRRQERGFL